MKYTYLISWCWSKIDQYSHIPPKFEDTVADIDVKIYGKSEIDQIRNMLYSHIPNSWGEEKLSYKITILNVSLLHCEE